MSQAADRGAGSGAELDTGLGAGLGTDMLLGPGWGSPVWGACWSLSCPTAQKLQGTGAYGLRGRSGHPERPLCRCLPLRSPRHHRRSMRWVPAVGPPGVSAPPRDMGVCFRG